MFGYDNNIIAQTLNIAINGNTSGQPLAAANAGIDILQTNPTFTMAATPPSVGTGTWSIVSGTATITTPNSPTTTVTGIATGTSATLRWTVTDGACSVTDDVVLTKKGVYLTAKVFLEGAYNPATSLMRAQVTVPTTEPYTGLGMTHIGGGGETTTPAILNASGNDKIVDWVMVELRDKTTPTTVVATVSGLLKCDGNIVAADGTSALVFDAIADNYYVLIRHRNHIRFRSNAVLTFSGTTPTHADFTNGSVAAFSNGLKTVSGINAMYSGDANQDGSITASDYNLFWLPKTGQLLPYDVSDFNMDGFISATDANLFWKVNTGIFIPIN